MSDANLKTAGVLGGMGPDATVDFVSKLIALTPANCDQDHVPLLIDHNPGVPDRQRAIAGGGDNVSPALTSMGLRLEAAGADFLVMVCNTAHVFVDEMLSKVTIPFISIIDESIAEIDDCAASAKTIGVMATVGCVNTGVYQSAINASGREPVLPDEVEGKRLMQLINAIKAGQRGSEVENGMHAIASHLHERGADVVISGCTEIPIAFDGRNFPVPVIASTDVLAQRTFDYATGARSLYRHKTNKKGS